MLKKLPIFGNEHLMRLFRYLPPYKGLIIGAGLAMRQRTLDAFVSLSPAL